MTKRLDVLLLESQPYVGETTAVALEAAGHRVHRCHDQGDTGFACRGLAGTDPCPIDEHVDAAVLVRPDGSEVPTPHEDGVRCAIRAGVPVVEVGDAAPDPFAPWITLRADEATVADACHEAIELARTPLIEAIVAKIAPILSTAGIDPAGVQCRIDTTWPSMDVRIQVVGAVDRALEQSLSVRALDAIRPEAGSYKTVNVTVHGSVDA